MNRNELRQYIQHLTPISDSNLKFMNLIKTRLMSEGISVDNALDIVSVLEFDFSNVNEDDDTLSDIATDYAEYCKKVHDKLKLHGLNNPKFYGRVFNRVFLKVDF